MGYYCFVEASEEMRAVATDGHRLAYASMALSEDTAEALWIEERVQRGRN
jgi:DNA polymerase III sliding clamp (beta) subunit (PCNA family)